MEVFDMSEASAGQQLDREWRVVSRVLAWQRYGQAVVGVPRSKVGGGGSVLGAPFLIAG